MCPSRQTVFAGELVFGLSIALFLPQTLFHRGVLLHYETLITCFKHIVGNVLNIDKGGSLLLLLKVVRINIFFNECMIPCPTGLFFSFFFHFLCGIKTVI